jgi:hypothetical protein
MKLSIFITALLINVGISIFLFFGLDISAKSIGYVSGRILAPFLGALPIAGIFWLVGYLEKNRDESSLAVTAYFYTLIILTAIPVFNLAGKLTNYSTKILLIPVGVIFIIYSLQVHKRKNKKNSNNDGQNENNVEDNVEDNNEKNIKENYTSITKKEEKTSNEMKTSNTLNDKIWYRLLGVIYLFSFLGILTYFSIEITSNTYITLNEKIVNLLWLFLITIIVFEILIRRSFYYIFLGKVNPPEYNFWKNKRDGVIVIFIILLLFGIVVNFIHTFSQFNLNSNSYQDDTGNHRRSLDQFWEEPSK